MKKTLSINIAGIVFHIEEDAYATLDAYLKSIHAYFKHFEGAKDIVDDIEARIAEKFWNIRETEKTEVITQVHVDELIASLGTVADFKEIESDEPSSEKAYTEPKKDASKKVFRRDLTNKKLGGVAGGIANYFEIDPIWVRLILIVGFFGLFPLLHAANLVFWIYVACWIAIPGEITNESDKSYRKFYRDPERKVVGGVMAGIAAYTGWDIGLLRVLAVISLFFFGTGAAAYIIIMAITPEAKSVTDKMAMTGEPITLENIEKNIKETFQPDSVEEKPLTRLLLFPFRTLATIFTAFKPLLTGIRWFAQYLSGVILVIIALGFAVALVAATTAGFSGFDHGVLGLSFGEAVPIFLLAQDLPAWAVYAAFAAIIPMILGIGISGLSLLVNRKITNKPYRYASTTFAIIGWIGLFAAFSMIGRNFQRTASINQIKEISADSSYIFQLNPDSQESIWEKMLGNTIIADELLDEDELHDFNRGGFSRTQISLEGYDGKTIQIIQFAKSNGRTRAEAEQNAKAIQYNFDQKGKSISFDSHFGMKNFKFRNQRLRVKVLVPFGVNFSMTREFALYMENVLESGYFDQEEQDLFVGSQWTFSKEKGLVCLNRTPNQTSEGETFSDNSSTNDFSFSKTLPPFTRIEMPSAESASVQIKQGATYQVSYTSTENIDVFSSKAMVENGVLKFPPVQAGLEIVIETPELKQVDLGGNARTEIQGFDLAKLDVILRDFHSLTLQGKSEILQAAAYDSSELMASGWSTKKAFLAIGNQAKMDINASELIQGKKGMSSEFINKDYSGLKIRWNATK